MLTQTSTVAVKHEGGEQHDTTCVSRAASSFAPTTPDSLQQQQAKERLQMQLVHQQQQQQQQQHAQLLLRPGTGTGGGVGEFF